MLSFVLLFSLFLTTFVASKGCDVLGVPSKDCDFYKQSEIVCGKSGKKIPKSLINDDYCDCPESGIDEPGTSACNNGKFYCRNSGYRSKYIYSSFVNDGLCDCCDGSDESFVKCENNCKLFAEEELKELKLQEKLYNDGLNVKKSLIKFGKNKINEKKNKLNELNSLIETQESITNELKAKKEELEEKERNYRDELKEKRRKEREAEEALRKANETENNETISDENVEKTETTETSDKTEATQDTPKTDEKSETEEKSDEEFPYPKEYMPPPDEQLLRDFKNKNTKLKNRLIDLQNRKYNTNNKQDEEKEEKQEKEENKEDKDAFPYPEEYRVKKDSEENKEDFEWDDYDKDDDEIEDEEYIRQLKREQELEKEIENEEISDPLLEEYEADDSTDDDNYDDGDYNADQDGYDDELLDKSFFEIISDSLISLFSKISGFFNYDITHIVNYIEKKLVPNFIIDEDTKKKRRRNRNKRREQRRAKRRQRKNRDKKTSNRDELDHIDTPFTKAAKEARDKYNDENRKLRDLNNEKNEIDEFLNIDFGPNDEFVSLYDQCFNIDIQKYTYTFCPFKNTEQKEGSSTVRMGKYESFDYKSNPIIMKFDKGQSCWKGPQRSTKVEFYCNDKNSLESVNEPSTCTYTMKFFTPLACTQQDLIRLKQNIINQFKEEL